jgi:hypothetical protein
MHKNQDPGSGIRNTAKYTEFFYTKNINIFPIVLFSVPYLGAKFLTGSSPGTTLTSFIGNAHHRSRRKIVRSRYMVLFTGIGP